MPHLHLVAIANACLLAPLAADGFAGTLNFHDVTAQRITQTVPELANNEKAVDAGDFDNDGDLDVVIANAYSDFGVRRNKLYRNDGGVFHEISGAPAIPGFSVADVSRVAFLRDYDGDGWLDIAVINDGDSNPNKLYLNVHPGDAFDHFELVGTSHFPEDYRGAANSAVSIDADSAGGFDLYIACSPNDIQDRLWLNDGKGYFIDATATNVPSELDTAVDVSAGDLNGDGKLDLLLANQNVPCKIYYNDLPGTDSTGPGDFYYLPTGVGLLTDPPQNENAMEPGDFDGDGRADIYWSDATRATQDRVLRNTGNDAAGMAILEMLPVETLPLSVTARASRKATVADLNGDGRLDVVVMKEEPNVDSRPTVLRNVSVNDEIAFVDWTPGLAFPAGQIHKGWHAAVFDSDGDGGQDIFLGGWAGDHLFVRAAPEELDESEMSDKPLPPIFNRDAVAIYGSAGPSEVDAYFTSDIATGFISAVLSGPDDYKLEIQTANHVVLGISDRGAAGVEEALQVDFSATTLKIVVTVLDCAALPPDLDGDCTVGVTDLLSLLSAWGPNPGDPADFDGNGAVDVADFLALLSAWGPVLHDYLLELLARN